MKALNPQLTCLVAPAQQKNRTLIIILEESKNDQDTANK